MPGIASIGDMRGGHRDIERAARLLQLAHGADDPEDPAPTAAAIFETAGKAGTVSPDAAERMVGAARLWRSLRGALGLAVYDGAAVRTAGKQVGAFVARSCGADDMEALDARIAEVANLAAADIDALAGVGGD